MSLRLAFIKGAKWSFVQQVMTQVINYVSLFWLANLVTPYDFGKITLAVVLIGVFESINGFGVSQLIVRDDIKDVRAISTYFWFSLLLSFGLTIICNAAGGIYAQFFHMADGDQFFVIIAVSSISLVINTVNSFFNSLYSRDLDFKTPPLLLVVSLLVGNATAIVIAYFGFGYWALIIRNILPMVFLSICFLSIRRYQIQLYFDRALIKGTWAFTSNFTYFNALNYLVRNMDYIVIGKFFDLATVGQYTIAYKIMIFPLKNITSRIQSVLYPLLSKVKDDLNRVERIYTTVVSSIGYFSFPLAVLISSLAFLWVPTVFDVVKYDKLVVLVQILSFVGCVQALTSPVMSLYLISGKTKALFYMGIFTSLINCLGFLAGGISGDIYLFATIYAVIQVVIAVPLSNYVPFRIVKFDFIKFLRGLWAPLAASVASYFIIRVTVSFLSGPSYFKISLLVCIGVAAYIVALFMISGTKLLERIKQVRSLATAK